MFSLTIVSLGTLLSLAGLAAVAPQVKARRIDGASLAAWLFRSGIFVLLAGESIAFFAKPDPLVAKFMLIAGAAILFTGFTLLPHEWQSDGFILEKSFSWQIVLLGLAAFWMAVIFVEIVLGLIGAVVSFAAERFLRVQVAAGRVDFDTMRFTVVAIRVTILILTAILLFL